MKLHVAILSGTATVNSNACPVRVQDFSHFFGAPPRSDSSCTNKRLSGCWHNDFFFYFLQWLENWNIKLIFNVNLWKRETLRTTSSPHLPHAVLLLQCRYPHKEMAVEGGLFKKRQLKHENHFLVTRAQTTFEHDSILYFVKFEARKLKNGMVPMNKKKVYLLQNRLSH